MQQKPVQQKPGEQIEPFHTCSVTCKTKYAILETTYPNIPMDFCQLLEVGGDQWHMLPTLPDEFLKR
jgi:hypothetical protein